MRERECEKWNQRERERERAHMTCVLERLLRKTKWGGEGVGGSELPNHDLLLICKADRGSCMIISDAKTTTRRGETHRDR